MNDRMIRFVENGGVDGGRAPGRGPLRCVRRTGSPRPQEDHRAALRRAFYVDCRTISLVTTITDVAAEAPGVDADLVFRELSRGTHRRTVHDHSELARSEVVQGSPHLFRQDGRHVHDPAVRLTWTAEHGRGFPVIRDYRPEVWSELVEAARTGN